MEDRERISNIGIQTVLNLVQIAARPGTDLLEEIEEGVRRAGIRCGVIVSGIGALEKALFRNLKRFPESFPVGDENRLYLKIDKPMELVSLGGWIASRPDGEPEIHAHFSASMVEADTVRTLGGHLTRGTICGIKMIVAILVLADGSVRADIDPRTRSFDLFFDQALQKFVETPVPPDRRKSAGKESTT